MQSPALLSFDIPITTIATQNFVLSCLMMQYASSLDPNDDGSYNPLRYYADVLNYVFNALFVGELGIRSTVEITVATNNLLGTPRCVCSILHCCNDTLKSTCFCLGHSTCCALVTVRLVTVISTVFLQQHVCAVVAPILPTALEDLRSSHRHLLFACPNSMDQHTVGGAFPDTRMTHRPRNIPTSLPLGFVRFRYFLQL
jgi:hypothetical protein